MLLLADCFVAHQPPIALRQQARRRQRGIGALGRGFIGGGVDLVQLLALLDVGAFHEQPLQDDAVHLRADFGDTEGGGPARQRRVERHGLVLQRDHLHFGRLGCGRLVFLATGGKDRDGDGQHARNQSTPGAHCLHSDFLEDETE
ncbi:hypothetical protein D3C87_1222220 [compost metagenome]